jgi:4'-phosphopantetheinyl transferase
MSEFGQLRLNWAQPSEFPTLGPGEIHVWAVPLEGESPTSDDVAAMLSADELARAADFVIDPPRRAFVATRLALRSLLGRYLDVPPREVSIAIDPHGKPRLMNGDLCFNVSHSGTLGLIAVTRGSEIGIDVEQLRPVERLMDIAERQFHPQEQSAIRAASPEQSTATFLRCWTRKEAVIKSIGAGLNYPLAAFRVMGSQITERSSQVVELSAQGDVPDSRCFLCDVEPCDAYAAAVATQTAQQSVLGFTYSP